MTAAVEATRDDLILLINNTGSQIVIADMPVAMTAAVEATRDDLTEKVFRRAVCVPFDQWLSHP
jgi:hypothetical protein